mmetsp:Transcript_86025/g.174621  ORF Transcript_86025/g.174621 Transcript_86025/m.174621 type:complete len:131 (-) Transcript_86025:588-980(-)
MDYCHRAPPATPLMSPKQESSPGSQAKNLFAMSRRNSPQRCAMEKALRKKAEESMPSDNASSVVIVVVMVTVTTVGIATAETVTVYALALTPSAANLAANVLLQEVKFVALMKDETEAPLIEEPTGRSMV